MLSLQVVMSRLVAVLTLLSSIIAAHLISVSKQITSILAKLNPIYNSPSIQVQKNIWQFELYSN